MKPAKGCPPLRSEPFLADRLNDQLDDQARTFLADQTFHLSPIFDWFKEDFINKAGSVQAFVAPFFPKDFFLKSLSDGAKIRYTDYDWTLNERRGVQ